MAYIHKLELGVGHTVEIELGRAEEYLIHPVKKVGNHHNKLFNM